MLSIAKLHFSPPVEKVESFSYRTEKNYKKIVVTSVTNGIYYQKLGFHSTC